jgi:hypothetical protein
MQSSAQEENRLLWVRSLPKEPLESGDDEIGIRRDFMAMGAQFSA